MRGNKLFLIVLLVIFSIFTLFAIGYTQESEKDIKIRLAHTSAVSKIYDVPMYAGSFVFKNVVETRTQGKVSVELYPGNQLGNGVEQIEMARTGRIEMVVATTGGLSNFVSEIQPLASIPFLFDSEEIAWKVLDGSYGKKLSEEILKKTGLRVLGITENGFRQFANMEKPIHSVSDFKGMKFRMMTIPAHLKLVELLGAAGIPLSWGDIFTAVKQGVVDGMDSPLWVLWGHKLIGGNLQKYVLLDNHLYDVHFVLINDKFYQKLSDDMKRIVREAAEAEVITQRGTSQLSSSMVISEAQAAGVEFYAPTQEEKEEFKSVTQKPIIEWLYEQGLKDWVDDLISAVDEEVKNSYSY